MLKNPIPKRIPTLSIVVPVFNEGKTILRLLEKVQAVKLPGIRKEIIVVNDGSTDGTAALLEKANLQNGRILSHERNQGKGAAIQTAILHASGDFFIIQDGDLEYDPKDYSRLLAPLLAGTADAVYGSRFEGDHKAFTFWNYLGNKFLTFMANLLYEAALTDMETGYKAFKTSVFRSIPLQAKGFDFDPEVTAKILKARFKIFEVPVSYHGRDSKNGKKITWWDGCKALFCLLRLQFTK